MPYTIRGTLTQFDISECKPDVTVDTYDEALRFIQANMYTIHANMFEKQTTLEPNMEQAHYTTYSIWNSLEPVPIRWSNRQPIANLLTEIEPDDGAMTIYFGSMHNNRQLWCFSVKRTA